ncbi:MAG: class II aldolase/adducin family protein [Ktedonobacteraceae bacterium]
MTTHISLNSLKDQLLQAVDLLEKASVMSHSGHGNMSVRIPGTEHLLLASTSKFAQLTSEQMVVVTFDGEVIEGSLPSVTREIVGMHAGVYRLRGVGAVIHTHSPHVTSFALAHKPLPCVYEALLRFGVTEDIPVAAWAPRGSRESVSNIIEQLQLHPATPAVLLANHGLLAFGRDPIAAAQVVIAMEEAAESTLEARVLGGEQSFPDGALEQERRHMQQFGSV